MLLQHVRALSQPAFGSQGDCRDFSAISNNAESNLFAATTHHDEHDARPRAKMT